MQIILAAGATEVVHTGSSTNTVRDRSRGLGVSVWNDAGDRATLKGPGTQGDTISGRAVNALPTVPMTPPRSRALDR